MECALCRHQAEIVCIPADATDAQERVNRFIALSAELDAVTKEATELESIKRDISQFAPDSVQSYVDLLERMERFGREIDRIERDVEELVDIDPEDCSDIDDSLFPAKPDNIDALSFRDVSHLESLVYRYVSRDGDDDVEVVIDCPAKLAVAPDGTHYIIDVTDVGSVVPRGAFEITAYPLPGHEPFETGPLW